jgi:hypothetical protein
MGAVRDPGRPPAALEDHERRPGGHPQPSGHRRAGRAVLGGLDERVGDAGQGQRRQHRAGDVEPATGRRVLRLRHVPRRHRHHGRRQREVEQEDPPPPDGADDPAAQERADGGGDPAQARPRTDGPRPVLSQERGLDDGQRAGREQRAADSLQGPGGDEHPDAEGQPAQRGGQREPHHPDEEDPAPPQPVTERAPKQDQPGQGQRVGGDGPLQAGQ